MKKLLRTRPIWLLILSPLLAALLLTFGYAAFAKSRRADVQKTNNTARLAPAVEPFDLDKDDGEMVEKRRAYLDRFYGNGPGQIPVDSYGTALAAARALPQSPLLKSGRFVGGEESPDSLLPWTFPVPPPIANDWGGGGCARIDAIAVDPNDANADTVYVGSEAGLAGSTDGGDSWVYLTDGIESQSIRSIAIDPVASNIIYAGTGIGDKPYFGVGIYRSIDSGAHWDLISGPIVSSPFSGGQVVKIAIDPVTAGSTTATTVYASLTKNGVHSLWRSTNSGASWTNTRSASGAGGFYDIAIDPAAPATVYITAPDGVFKRNFSGGERGWIRIHPALPSSSARSSLAFSLPPGPVRGRELYLGYEVPGNPTRTWIEESSDAGHTIWHNVSTIDGGFDFFAVDPVHPNRIFVGGGGDLRYSMTGGATWITSAGGCHVDIRSIAFCETNTERHFLGTDGGIYRADYEGPDPAPFTWANKNQNLAGALLYGVGLSRNGNLIMGNQDNGTQLHREGTPPPPPWVMLHGGDGFKPKIHPTDGEVMYDVELNYLQPIGPDHADPRIRSHGTTADITPVDAYGERTAFFLGMHVKFGALGQDHVLMGFQNVWRTLNSGGNWARIGGSHCPGPSPAPNNCGIWGDGQPIEVLYEAPSDSNVIYATTAGKLLVTSNANAGNPAGSGAVWDNITPANVEGQMTAVIVHPTQSGVAYLATTAHIYKTINRGGAWTPETIGPNFVFRDLAFHPSDPETIVTASDQGVFARFNGVWGNLSTGIPKGMAIWGLSFNPTSLQLAAATYGRGVYMINLDTIPPTATINFPANGAHVRGTITVLGTALDNHHVASAQFKLDGVNLGGSGWQIPDVPPPNVSVDWNTTASLNGSHVLTLVVKDAVPNTTTSVPVTVTVDNLAPTVSITEPEDGKKVSGKVTVSADASDNSGVAGVQFYVDGDSIGDEITSWPFSIDWDTSKLRNNDYTLTAVARDEAGNTTTSNAVTVTTSN
jgi:hypothetical protein